MAGVSPIGVAENGTRTGKRSFDCDFMCVVFPNLLPCLPSLATGLVPAGQHYYEGSDSSAKRIKGLHAAEVSLLISIELLNIPSLTTLLPFRSTRFNTLRFCSPCEPPHRPAKSTAARSWASSGTWCEVRGSRLARTLPDGLGQIEFAFATDCSFVSGCSPPFLLKTQLPSTTGR